MNLSITFDSQNKAIYHFTFNKIDILDIERYLCWGFLNLKQVERDVYFQYMYTELPNECKSHMIEQYNKLVKLESLDMAKPYVSSTDVWTRLGRPS